MDSDDDEGGDKSEKDELKGKSQSDFVARWVRTVSSQVRRAHISGCACACALWRLVAAACADVLMLLWLGMD